MILKKVRQLTIQMYLLYYSKKSPRRGDLYNNGMNTTHVIDVNHPCGAIYKGDIISYI
jgi:hypothetical protein